MGADAPPRGVNTIDYKRAKNDIVYRAQSWLDTATELFGANSKEAESAAQAVQEARREAESKKTPAQRATDLRADRITYIDSIAERVTRMRALQEQQDSISAELEKLDGETRQAVESVTLLDEQIAKLEAEGGLKAPVKPGGQLNMSPDEILQRSLRDTIKHAQEAIHASGFGQYEANDRLKEYEVALGELQGRAMSIMQPDADMSEVGSLDSDNQDAPKAKTPRRNAPHTVTSSAAVPAEDAEDDESTWTQSTGTSGSPSPEGEAIGAEHAAGRCQEAPNSITYSTAQGQREVERRWESERPRQGPGGSLYTISYRGQ